MADHSTPSPDVPQRPLDPATCVSDRVRMKAHVVDFALIMLIDATLLLAILLWTHRADTAGYYPRLMLTVCGGVSLAGIAIQTAMLYLFGTTPSMRRFNLRWVNDLTGERAGIRAVMKWVLQILSGVVSIGILPFAISFFTKDRRGRTVYDRICGTQTVAIDCIDGHMERGIPCHLTADGTEEETQVPRLPEATADRHEYVLNVRSETPQPPARDDDVETTDDVSVRIGEPSPPSQAHVGESQWAFTAPPSALDLAQMGQTIMNSRTYGEVALPLSDVNELTALERSMGVRPHGSVRLVFDDGTRYDLVGTLLVGRDPVAKGDFTGAAVLSVLDEARSVSKIHLAVSVRDGQVYVRDLYSTNGSKLSLPDGGIRPLKPGLETHVPAGVMVIFGRRRMLVSG